ncbi:DUF6978 family protein [Methanolapillus millepedarum]|uniref:Uncharacterized protein n=1 Tax=Methanolapillus millepedarum TaxID=3028296 RepID=A0AA96V2Q2_9EURY|nr:hypothetical protein MsAc7_03620 [Methanosarcinaceae archaeon Ac7]
MTLTDEEANHLIKMDKMYVGNKVYPFPERLSIPLCSTDRKVEFILDIAAGNVKLSKSKFQNRVYKNIVLMRIDLDGNPHRNPNGEIIPCPHLHCYKEGCVDRWATPLPKIFTGPSDPFKTLQEFMNHCHIILKPEFENEFEK